MEARVLEGFLTANAAVALDELRVACKLTVHQQGRHFTSLLENRFARLLIKGAHSG